MVHSAFLQLAIIIAVLCQAFAQDEKSCDDCTTLHQHINATGDNLVTFEPCLQDPNCQHYCQYQYEIVAAKLLSNTSSQDQEVKLYWSDAQILLVMPSSNLASQTLEPYDLVVNVEYVCHKHIRANCRSPLNVNFTVTLKPIRIKLHTNSSHGEIKEDQPLELDCIISGSLNTEKANILIHHEREDMGCTPMAKEIVGSSQRETICTTTISSFSQSENGKYYCTLAIGDKYFSSKMKAIEVNEKSGLEMSTKIIMGVGAFGLLLMVTSIVSITVNVYFKIKINVHNAQPGNINEEGQPLHPEGNRHDYGTVADAVEGNGGGGRDSPAASVASSASSRRSGDSHRSVRSHLSGQSGHSNRSDGSNRSGSSLGSRASKPDYHTELPPQEGNKDSSV